MLARDLRYFLVLVAHRHVGRAAAALGLSQPALSKSLRRLEDTAEGQLFERSRHGISLTAAGRMLADRARVILRDIDAALEDVQALQGDLKGTVRIGAIPTVCENILPRALSQIAEHLGGLHFSIASNWNHSLFAMLDAGEADLIVTGLKAPLANARYICQPLFQDHVSVVCRTGHPLMNQRKLAPRVLDGWDWAMAGGMAPGRQWLEEQCTRYRLQRPNVAIETDSLVLAREMVRSSDLLAFLPHLIAKDAVEKDKLLYVPIEEFTWKRTIYIVSLTDRRFSAAAGLLVSSLTSVCEHNNGTEVASRGTVALPRRRAAKA